jgi:hypothetical protein
MIKVDKKQLTNNAEGTLINALNCYKDNIEDDLARLSYFNEIDNNKKIELKRVNRLLKSIEKWEVVK